MNIEIEKLDEMMADYMKKIANEGEKVLIRKVHSIFFKNISSTEFEGKLSGLDDDKRRRFIDACLFLEESKNIKTKYPVIKYLLLFISVETLIGENHKTFYEWIITKEDVKGKKKRDDRLSDLDIRNKEDFKDTINALFKIYREYYGVTESVRRFFINYSDLEDKKKIIRSFKRERKKLGEHVPVHECYIDDNICYKHSDNKWNCYPSAKFGCPLEQNKEEKINEALGKTISILYDLFRNQVVHSGVRSNFVDNGSTLISDYNGKVVISISFDELRDIIIRGIQKYYKTIDGEE